MSETWDTNPNLVLNDQYLGKILVALDEEHVEPVSVEHLGPIKFDQEITGVSIAQDDDCQVGVILRLADDREITIKPNEWFKYRDK